MLPAPTPALPRRLLRAALTLALLLGLCLWQVGPARASSGVLLDGIAQEVDPWSHLSMLSDAQGSLSIQAALARAREMQPISGPHANLGSRKDVVWLRVPLRVAAFDDGRWLADIDYPSLDRVDLHLVRDGVPVRHFVLGDLLPYNSRSVPARSHRAELKLQPGADYEVWLRVQTRSAMIVPLRFIKAEAAHAQELRTQLVQGLLTGLALCLAVYALAQWVSNRDPMFLYYSVVLISGSLFFFSYYGLAPQHLWPEHAWLTDNAAPLFILIGVAATMVLVEHLLNVRASAPWLALTLRALSLGALCAAALFMLGFISYQTASIVATVLGPMPILLGVHLAWGQARAGDEAARYVLIGWAAHATGTVVMASLMRGLVDSNLWTQHALQAGWLAESIAWMHVLGVRAGAIRKQAARAVHEREMLTKLAYTDPLTGLPNRRGLDVALQGALAASGPGQGLAVYVIDLDGFKAVNDRLGHEAGDDLLVAASARMRSRLRNADVVARLGGDEFVVLAPGMPDESVAWQVGRKLLEAFNEPFDIKGQTCRVGLTIGFALAPLDGSHAPDLLKRADAAMYAGKESGKGTVRRGGASAGLVNA